MAHVGDMRRILLIGLAGVLSAAVLVLLLVRLPAVEDWLVRLGVERALGRADTLFEGDGMRVLMCGTASPMPHRTRARPCVAVIAKGKFYVVDAGPGSWNNLALWRVAGERIGGVFFTHFHSDHIGELGELNMQTWVAGRPAPLPVYGPPGVERLVAGFTEAYALDTSYRVAHHGADFLPAAAARMEPHASAVGPNGSAVVLDAGGLRVSTFSVDHAPVEPAVGYRFDFAGRSVVISGDTVKHPGVIAAAKGADVLVHEAQNNHFVGMIGEIAARLGRPRIAKLMGDIPSYHTTPVQAAEAANEAGVRLLVLYHLTPPPPNALFERAFVRGVRDIRPDGVVLADDGLLVDLPAGSEEVRVGRVD
jgi:ribonuclease Z